MVGMIKLKGIEQLIHAYFFSTCVCLMSMDGAVSWKHSNIIIVCGVYESAYSRASMLVDIQMNFRYFEFEQEKNGDFFFVGFSSSLNPKCVHALRVHFSRV